MNRTRVQSMRSRRPSTALRSGPATIPEMPAMRPSPSKKSAVAAPIRRPPASDAQGVKEIQSICIRCVSLTCESDVAHAACEEQYGDDGAEGSEALLKQRARDM
jgi:hypothetical protein